MPGKPVYLTAEGLKRLKEDLEYLRTVKRREVADAIQAAKEEGDITENSAYDEAKLQQGFLEGKIQTIEVQLRNAVIIEENGASDKVQVGSHVTVQEDGMGQTETFHIVGSAEADPGNGRISNESPIGSALLGRKAGDMIAVETPGGEITFKVLQIE
jgi:transcription elongation factor GreA